MIASDPGSYPIGYWLLTLLVGLLIVLIAFLARWIGQKIHDVWVAIKDVLHELKQNGGDGENVGDRIMRLEAGQKVVLETLANAATDASEARTIAIETKAALDDHAEKDLSTQGETNGKLDAILALMPKRATDPPPRRRPSTTAAKTVAGAKK